MTKLKNLTLYLGATLYVKEVESEKDFAYPLSDEINIRI